MIDNEDKLLFFEKATEFMSSYCTLNEDMFYAVDRMLSDPLNDTFSLGLF